MSTEIERKLISLLLDAENMMVVHDTGLRPEVFEEPINRRVFEWMTEHFRDNKTAPTPVVMETEFPAVPLIPVEEVGENIDWLITYLRRRWIINEGQDIIRTAVTSLPEDPEGTINALWQKAHAISKTANVLPPKPVPLTRVAQVPPFPNDTFPDFIADMITGTARGHQVDPAMAGCCALGALSACLGGKVRVKVREGWTESIVLWPVPIAESGERKSPVLKDMLTDPLQRAKEQLVEDTRRRRSDAGVAKQFAADRVKVLRNKASREDDVTKRTEYLREAQAQEAAAELIVIRAEPELFTADATTEAVGVLLNEQDGRIAAISAEGGIFDMMAGQYSDKPNFDVYLKGYSGDNLKVHRIGRDKIDVDQPAVTMCVMVQHDVLEAIARVGAFKGRGLLARPLWAELITMAGTRLIAQPPACAEVKKTYQDFVYHLAMLAYHFDGDAVELTLTPEADKEVQRIEAETEPLLGEDGEMSEMAGWGSKYAGTVVRIAGDLHVAIQHSLAIEAEADGRNHEHNLVIDAETVRTAERLAEYFRCSALNVLAQMGTNPVVVDASYLKDKILNSGQSVVSLRDMLR